MTIDGRVVAGGFVVAFGLAFVGLIAFVGATPLLPAPLGVMLLGTGIVVWGLRAGGKTPDMIGKRVRGRALGVGLAVAAVAFGAAGVLFTGIDAFGVGVHFVGPAVACAVVGMGGLVAAGAAFERVCRDCQGALRHRRYAIPDRRAMTAALEAAGAAGIAAVVAQARPTSAAEALGGASQVYADVEWCPSCRSVALVRCGTAARWLTRQDARAVVQTLRE